MDLPAGVLSVWGHLPSYDLIPPPLTHYSTYSHREGGEGEEELTRLKDRGAIVHKAGRKTNMIDCISCL